MKKFDLIVGDLFVGTYEGMNVTEAIEKFVVDATKHNFKYDTTAHIEAFEVKEVLTSKNLK